MRLLHAMPAPARDAVLDTLGHDTGDELRCSATTVTNAVRHAGATRVDVRIGRGPRQITISVTDDGRAGQLEHPTLGHGLRGMRERTHALGGSLRIEVREPHGWRVEAVLPVAETGS